MIPVGCLSAKFFLPADALRPVLLQYSKDAGAQRVGLNNGERMQRILMLHNLSSQQVLHDEGDTALRELGNIPPQQMTQFGRSKQSAIRLRMKALKNARVIDITLE